MQLILVITAIKIAKDGLKSITTNTKNTNMNITVIGASAGVGLETVKRALDRHHTVTTLSRTALQLPENKNLISLKGNALNKEDLKKSIINADAVIVALGTGKSMKPTTLYSDFAKTLMDVTVEFHKDVPFIFLTGFGAGASADYQPNFFMKLFFRFLLKDVYADKTKMEEIITNSHLDWIIVRPGLLKDQPLTEQYKIEKDLYKGIKIGSINRADVADFMVKQAEDPTYLRKYPALSNQ